MGTRKTKQRPRKNIRRLSKTNRRYRKTKLFQRKRSKNNKLKRYKYRGGSNVAPPVADTDVSVDQQYIEQLQASMSEFRKPWFTDTTTLPPNTDFDKATLISYLKQLNYAYNNITNTDIFTINKSDGSFDIYNPSLGIIVGCILIVLAFGRVYKTSVMTIGEFKVSELSSGASEEIESLRGLLSQEFIQGVYDIIDEYISLFSPIINPDWSEGQRNHVWDIVSHQIFDFFTEEFRYGNIVFSNTQLTGEDYNWREQRIIDFKKMVVDAVEELELKNPSKHALRLVWGFGTSIDSLISDYRDIGLDSMITILEDKLNDLKTQQTEGLD